MTSVKRVGPPSFYIYHRHEIDISLAVILSSRIMQKIKGHLLKADLHPAHGLRHCEKVAVEAGAIFLAETSSGTAIVREREELLLCAQIAGLLHDIKRKEDNHTVAGSLKAAEILTGIDIPSAHKKYITDAIRNHEAFKEVQESEDSMGELISNSLYDADKFRWGPDNFLITLWLIVKSTNISPEALHRVFIEKLEGIKRIKQTFRTETGKTYGPEFIDSGVEMGISIYREMDRLLEKTG